MIELRTLGTLGLRAADGREVESLLAHPKRAGLLVYLSVARPRGFHRRDALLAMFWPELDQDRARTALRKAVFQIRRALGDEVLVGRGDDELRIADHLVWCDARALDEALESGDAESAIALYRGPFLDAFFVSEAIGFEHWMEAERSRLHERAFDATWRLAVRDEQTGNAFGATFWARRAAALAPDDEKALRRLMELLDRQGDRAGAMQAYESFARRIAAEYDVEPSGETQALARAIRECSAKTPNGSTAAITDAAPAIVEVDEPPPAQTVADPSRYRSAARRGRAIVGFAATLVLAAVAVSLARQRTPADPVRENVVAVFPFTVRGDASVHYLGEGMASLLALGLDGAGDLRSVDPQALLGARDRNDAALEHPSGAGMMATNLGAGQWVVGDIVESNRRLRINAALYDGRDSSKPKVLASAEGPIDSVFSIVDRLAGQLLAGPSRGSNISSLAALTTHSLPALKAYLEGDRAFRRGKFREALNGFQLAVSLDSTFALAYYRLASAYSWSSNDSSRLAAARAERLADRLSPPARQLVEALRLFEAGESDSAERRYREILVRRPEDVEALFQLGEVLFHQNPPRGRNVSEAKQYFSQAFAFNDGDAPIIHLLELLALEGDYAAFESMLPRIEAGSHFWTAGQMVHVYTRGDDHQRASFEAELAKLRDSDLATTAVHALFLLQNPSSARRVVRALDDPKRPDELRAVGRILEAHVAMSAGRWRHAGRMLDSAASIDPVRAAEHAAVLHALPLLPIPVARLEEVRDQIERVGAAATPRSRGLLYGGDEAIHPALMSYSRSIIESRLGRFGIAKRLSAHMVAGATDSSELRRSLSAGAYANALFLEGKAEEALDRLRTIPAARHGVDLLGYSPFPGLRHERFLRAEAARAVNRFADAEALYSSFAEHSPFARVYIAPSHLRRAELAERAGRRTEAAKHYAMVAALWGDADPELQPVVARARARANQLR